MSDSIPPDTSPAPVRQFTAVMIATFAVSVAALGLSVVALIFALGILRVSPEPFDFEKEVRAYLFANPELIVQSVEAAQANEKAAAADDVAAALEKQHDEIFNNPATPIGINAQGDVGLVEFFDYNCPYCRKAEPIIDALEEADHGVKLIYKEFPILGAGSTFAAKAALASQKQGKYLPFHKAMMNHFGSITETSVLEIAATVGLDVEQLKRDMTSSALDEQIARNFDLAETLDINGTPSFIAGKQVVHGLVDAEAMKQLIATARQK